MSYAYLFAAILLIAIGQVLQKMAARQLDFRNGPVGVVVSLLRSTHFWSAAIVMTGGLVAWLLSLTGLDISKAYPLLGLSFVITTAASAVFLGEHVGAYRWVGVALISLGSAIMMTS
jgi:drug/metabolite transporter (DMT)-like permease